jgi:hypothetical protein
MLIPFFHSREVVIIKKSSEQFRNSLDAMQLNGTVFEESFTISVTHHESGSTVKPVRKSLSRGFTPVMHLTYEDLPDGKCKISVLTDLNDFEKIAVLVATVFAIVASYTFMKESKGLIRVMLVVTLIILGMGFSNQSAELIKVLRAIGNY